MARKTFTRSELAREAGCSVRTVDRYRLDGRIRPIPHAGPGTLYGPDALRELTRTLGQKVAQ